MPRRQPPSMPENHPLRPQYDVVTGQLNVAVNTSPTPSDRHPGAGGPNYDLFAREAPPPMRPPLMAYVDCRLLRANPYSGSNNFLYQGTIPDVADLERSIRAVGMLTPIVVAPWYPRYPEYEGESFDWSAWRQGDGYVVIDGRRRAFAAIRMDMSHVPCALITRPTIRTIAALTLIHNMIRSPNLRAEEAADFQIRDVSPQTVSERTGIPTEAIQRLRRIRMTLPPVLYTAFLQGRVAHSLAVRLAREPRVVLDEIVRLMSMGPGGMTGGRATMALLVEARRNVGLTAPPAEQIEMEPTISVRITTETPSDGLMRRFLEARGPRIEGPRPVDALIAAIVSLPDLIPLEDLNVADSILGEILHMYERIQTILGVPAGADRR